MTRAAITLLSSWTRPMIRPVLALSLAIVSSAAPVRAGETAAWPDTPMARLAAYASLQSLNADLLSHDSATLTLDRWCSRHGLAVGAKIVAQRQTDVTKPATAEVRQALKVGDADPVGYRRVRLSCGARILSEADNWYVPGRLTAEMNQTLDTSDAAFGRVVQPLNFSRRTLSGSLLWSPLPEGWDTGAPWPPATGQPLAIPSELLQHRALLTLPDGRPISLVVETYQRDVLAFAAPAAVSGP